VQEFVDAADGGTGDASQRIAQIRFGIDAVEFGAADPAVDSGGTFTKRKLSKIDFQIDGKSCENSEDCLLKRNSEHTGSSVSTAQPFVRHEAKGFQGPNGCSFCETSTLIRLGPELD
jgi:hypothetical protein